MDPYPSLALMQAYGATYPLLSEEEVIHEARRKRMRVGSSPPHPRGMILASSFASDTEMPQRKRRGQEDIPAKDTLTQTTSRPVAESSSRIRSDLQDAMKELRAVLKKIRRLSRAMDAPNDTTYSTRVIEEKTRELFTAVTMELGVVNPTSGNRGSVSVPVTRRPDESQFRTMGRDAGKRKRSRRIISLKRTYETMDVDLDPTNTDC